MSRMLTRIAICLGGVPFAAIVVPPSPAQTPPAPESRAASEPAAKEETVQKPTSIYDESADAALTVQAAVKRAARENQRVLVVFGGNWCVWCHRLHELFEKNKDIAKTLQYEYQRVLVDIGRFDKNLELAESYGVDVKKMGVPALLVLDGTGKALKVQNTGDLEAGERHDPTKVAAFLDEWKATPLDAKAVLDAALQTSAKDGRPVLLRFGAPWCGWCHKLQDVLDEPEVAARMARAYVDVKIDVDRMTGGKELRQQMSPKPSGIPWFAVLDASGKPLITCEGEKGNIGCPVEPEEIAHFMKMLQSTAKNLAAADLKVIEDAFLENAKKIKQAQP